MKIGYWQNTELRCKTSHTLIKVVIQLRKGVWAPGLKLINRRQRWEYRSGLLIRLSTLANDEQYMCMYMYVSVRTV